MTRGIRNLAGLLAVAVALACGGDEAETLIAAPPVQVERVAAHEITEQIQATGQLVAVDEASVAAEVSGRVTAILLREGAAAAAGDTVLEIDRERRQLELDNETAMVAGFRERIANEERELRRIQNLRKSQAASEAQLDAAATRVRSARSAFEGAVAKRGLAARAVADASVGAPFSGLIARRFVSVGDHVSVGEPLFDLVALDPVEVEFHLTERDSARVGEGDVVDVRVAPYPDQVFEARVHMISPRIDPVTRTLRVKARVDNAQRKLRPGLFARADLGVAVRDGVAMVPERALLQRSDGSVVFVLNDQERAERRNVQLGVFRNARVEVVSGVAVGERVIVRGMSRLVDGSAVDVRQADGSKAAPPSVADATHPSDLDRGTP